MVADALGTVTAPRALFLYKPTQPDRSGLRYPLLDERHDIALGVERRHEPAGGHVVRLFVERVSACGPFAVRLIDIRDGEANRRAAVPGAGSTRRNEQRSATFEQEQRPRVRAGLDPRKSAYQRPAASGSTQYWITVSSRCACCVSAISCLQKLFGQGLACRRGSPIPVGKLY